MVASDVAFVRRIRASLPAASFRWAWPAIDASEDELRRALVYCLWNDILAQYVPIVDGEDVGVVQIHNFTARDLVAQLSVLGDAAGNDELTLRPALSMALKTVPIHKLYAWVVPPESRWLEDVLSAMGFEEEARLRDYVTYPGTNRDVRIYGLNIVAGTVRR